MELHVPSVTLALINLGWVLIRVHIVPLLRYLQRAASQTPLVNVTPGSEDKMEAHAQCVLLALINLDCRVFLVQVVLSTISLELAASTSLSVNVMLDTRA